MVCCTVRFNVKHIHTGVPYNPVQPIISIIVYFQAFCNVKIVFIIDFPKTAYYAQKTTIKFVHLYNKDNISKSQYKERGIRS